MASKRTLDHSSCFPAPKKRNVSSCFVSSSSSTQSRWTYDVFLSFRGDDTRKNFTDHLYEALVQAGIRTFRDDDELPRGREISSELLKSIEGSRISMVVFSKNYASSRWCLDELVKIIECKKTLGQLLLPIFYDVDPSDIRHQTGHFGEAFGRHQKRFADEMEKVKVKVRRDALFDAANLSGWDLQNVANGHEAKFIGKIVKEVLCELKHTFLNVAVHPVGIDSCVIHIKSLLSIGSDDVRMIGIYGLGGIGKTTIAKAVYNHIFLQFEGSCFLANVREFAGQLNGLVQLQEQLLFELLGIKNLKIDNVDRGMNLIKERLYSKRVLIVLDDLDQLNQLNSLAGNRDWFGPGSRIIITTRDEHLLKGLKVHERYMAKKLNHKESLQLFNWHAFGETNPLENYADLANGIVSYASGLPLALEVLGSYLFGRNMVEWKSAFDKLQQIPHEKIQEKLRISFDALDDNIKDIFLDIACFFIEMDREYVITILNGCGFFAEIGISVLISRCLLRISENNKLMMHDLVRDMGREIIREKYPKEPEKRSRLWLHEDVCYVLQKNKGTEAVEGVILILPMLKKIQWSNKAFARMPKLRLLQINHVHLSGNFEHLFEELRWLCWHNCPLEYLPSNFHPEKLLVLDMQFSRFKTLRIDGKHLRDREFPRKFLHRITGHSLIEALTTPRIYDYNSSFNVGVAFYRAGDEESCSMELDDYPYAIITDKITKKIPNKNDDISFTCTPTLFFVIPESSGDYVWRTHIEVEEYIGYKVKGGEQFEAFIMPSLSGVDRIKMFVHHNKGNTITFHKLSGLLEPSYGYGSDYPSPPRDDEG
ncbi:TMV resistance protein N-like [Camellia sinensis]|uniref:TMV resistance protein N-like n=1 Tax=Camellia sinensis TaxID=4442 RepID=UPI00103581BE|nr:TMV resistance protein N-like [Camellia sinensis]